MAAKVLNIEVGDRVTKVCVSAKSKKSYQIASSFLMATPANAVKDGQILNPMAMADALRRQLAERGAGNVKNVVFTISSTKVASREVLLPPLKDNRIQTVVETNASDYFPVDMSSYCIAHTLLERLTGDNPGCRVQVTAAPRTLLEGYSALAEAAGLQLEAVDYCGNSQYQVLRSLDHEEVVMYVDVNVSNTLVSFMNNGLLLLQRNINVGGDELVCALMEAAGDEDGDFLAPLQRIGDAGYLDSLLPRHRQEDCLSRLVGGISRSADFFKSNRSATPISRVVLLGVCGSIAGLAQLVQEELGTEVVTLEDVSGIKFVANSVGGVNSYLSCVGSLVKPLDLLPEELRPSKKKKNKKRRGNDSIALGVVVFLLLTLAGVGLAGFSIWQCMTAQEEQALLEQRVQELAHVGKTAQLYEDYQATEAALRQIRAASDTHNAYLVDFLEEMERKMPSSLLLMSAVCDEQGVTLNIVTPGMEEADVVIKQLRSFASIQQIDVSTITETIDEGGISSATFSVRCGYNAPEEAKPVAEQAVEGGETA